MAVRVEEWTVSHWVTPGVGLYANYGDYLELSNLIPSRDGRQLRRVPAWSAQVRTDTNAIEDVRGAFYDVDNDRVVLIGTNASANLASETLDGSWALGGATQLHATPSNLGGASMRNIAWYGGVLYVIGSDGRIYSGSSYTSALAQFDATTTHRILAPIDERLYVVGTDGTVWWTSSDNLTLWTYDAPNNDLGSPQFFAGYRGYGLMITQDANGLMRFIRVPLDTSSRYFQEIAHLQAHGSLPDYGSLFCLHDDEVYFSPGYYSRMGGEVALDVYSYNGSRSQRVTQLQHDPNAGGSGYPSAAGFLSWRGELLYYALEGTQQTFKALRGGEFVEFPALSATASAQPFAGVFGGHLVATVDDTNEGVHYLEDDSASDGYLVTSRLDMGRPGKQKRLSQVAVLLSDAVADFGCKIEYRVDDTAAWTDGGTDTETRRAVVSGLGDTFYTLQLRITLDDDTGNDEDVRIDALSVLYSVDA